MKFLLAEDTISGKEGTVVANINGRIIELAEIKNISAKVDKQKKEFKALGYRGTQHKTTGWTGTGTATYYYVTSYWLQMVAEYIKTGKDTYFDLIITNTDPGSSIGEQTIRLDRCNLDGVDVSKLDVEADFLDAQFNFTFSDLDVLTSFSPYSAV